MLRLVIEKEYAELRHSPRLRWALLVVYGLFFAALLTGTRTYLRTHAARQTAQEASYQQWLHQDKKNPHAAAHYGFYAFKPVPLLAVLDKGVDDYLGTNVYLEAHKQDDATDRAAQDAAELSRYGSLTVGFVWQYLLPLVIILLTFNLVSQERENGTLRLLLTTATPPATLVLGKGLAVAKVVLGWFFGPMLLLGLGAMALAGGGAAVAGQLPALLVLAVGYSLFFSLVIALGLAVSARVQSSGLALLLLLGGWALGAFLVPRLSGSIASRVYPTPSAFAFTQQVTHATDEGMPSLGVDSEVEFRRRLQAQTLRRYGVDSLSQLPVSYAPISLQAGEDRSYRIFDYFYGQLARTVQQQNQLRAACNLLSPLLAMRNLSRALAGTDYDKHLDFTAQAEHKRRTLQRQLNDDMQAHADPHQPYETAGELWRAVAPFRYQPLSVGAVLRHQALALLALALWAAGAAAWLYKSARRLRLG